MAEPIRIQRVGGFMYILMDDGTRLRALAGQGGQWYVNGNTPPEPGQEWMHPLGNAWPRNEWTTYSGEPSHDAGAVDFGTGFGGEPPLYAPCNGTVLFDPVSGGGAGNTVVIQPDDESVGITYLHMNRVDVSPNDRVTTGQIVGLAGWTGNVSPPGPGGAHLHLEIRSNGATWGAWVPAVSYFASKGVTL